MSHTIALPGVAVCQSTGFKLNVFSPTESHGCSSQDTFEPKNSRPNSMDFHQVTLFSYTMKICSKKFWCCFKSSVSQILRQFLFSISMVLRMTAHCSPGSCGQKTATAIPSIVITNKASDPRKGVFIQHFCYYRWKSFLSVSKQSCGCCEPRCLATTTSQVEWVTGVFSSLAKNVHKNIERERWSVE